MKKVIMVMLAVALMMSLAIPAFAVSSPTSTDEIQTCGMENCKCQNVTWGQRRVLPDEKKAAFEEAKETLKDAIPEGFKARNFVYHWVLGDCTSCTVSMTIKGANTEVAAKQYLEGEWKDVSATLEGTEVTVVDVVDGPLAIFTAK